MSSFTASIRQVGVAVQARVALFAAALLALFPQRVRTAKGLSFLEYAILAAAIVGVGVLIAVFFRDSLNTLLGDTQEGFNQGNFG